MADEQNKQGSAGDDISKAVGGLTNGAKSAANAVKAAGEAAAGNVVGAVMTVLKDEGLRNAIIACLLIFALIIVAFPMMIGAAIIAVVEAIARNWAENWDEAWMEQGVNSAGNSLYLYTLGGLNALIDAGIESIADGWDALMSAVFPTKDKADNGSLGSDQVGEVTQEDYDVILKSLIDEKSLVGTNGALQMRLDMIKARVEERGKQIQTIAVSQYNMEAMGAAFAAGLAETRANPYLYCGVDSLNSRVTVDTSAFELSDIQAIKILAAYSAQHDCDITSIDMWDLMDYCGWYDYARTQMPTNLDARNSIYHTEANAVIATEIGGVVNIGEDIYDIYQLPAPEIPYWSGSFAPQWYVEETEQIRRIAKKMLTEQGETIDNVDVNSSLSTTALDALGIPTPSRFRKLSNYETYGLVDIIYTATNATLTVSRTEYDVANAVTYDYVKNNQYIMSQISLRNGWAGAIGPQEKTTSAGNVVKRTEDNKNIFVLKNAAPDYKYALRNEATGNYTEYFYVPEEESDLVFEGLAADTAYTLCRKDRIDYVPDPTEPPEPTTKPAPIVPPGNEEIMLPQADKEQPIKGGLPSLPVISEKIDSFRTYPPEGSNETYQLVMEVNISFAARSIDDIAMNVIGLWKGSLNDTTTDVNGDEYLTGYEGNRLLQKTWKDTCCQIDMSDPDNMVDTERYEFTRLQGYQYETYQDMVVGLATLLGYDTTGLVLPEYSYGENIVEMAQKEIAYYQANNMLGGARYWEICGNAEGVRYDPSQPWCVCFVNAIAYLCGYIGPGKCLGNFNDGYWIYGCGTHYRYLTDNNQYAIGYKSPADGYKPVPGDFVYYGRSTSSTVYGHIGIVKEVTPEGKLITLEGNVSGNGGRVCKECIWNIDYEIGSYAYSYQGERYYVVAYAHPKYPSPFIENPAYLSVQGVTSAWAQARYVGNYDSQLLIAGVCRFRQSQFQTVVEDLKNNYVELYTEELESALESGDMTLFVNRWNITNNSGKSEAFIKAQKSIFVNRYMRPLVDKVQSESHFNWTYSNAREEVLWALATTTDQYDALANLLNTIALLLPESATDEELLTFLQSEDFATMLNDRKASLWVNESEFLQVSWINGIRDAIVIIANNLQNE